MADLFDVLEADHIEVKSMLHTLGASSEPEKRAKLAETLVIEESKHEAAEEMHFWPAVRRYLVDGDRLADEAISQEEEGKQVLNDLDKAEAGSPAFDELVTRFQQAAQKHIAFEENEVWPKLLAVLNAQQIDELGAEIESAKATGPTRPHPKTPSKPGVLKTAGAAAAATDRARDRASGRGRH
ncbi:MAG: hemerythrin domain-containing protein [Acidimicrobiaceae bacterium]|nr:hemerythrin domain-containing protein [Acidimicrobiaceae bacterium]